MKISDSEELEAYKNFVNNKLVEITTEFKSKIDSLPLDKKNKQYVSEIVKEFFTSSQLVKFYGNSIDMAERLEPDNKLIAYDYHKEKVIEILLKDLSKHVTSALNTNTNERAHMYIEETLKEIKQNPPRPSIQERSYDQVVKGDIKISEVKNNSEYSHKIKFNKIGNFLQYQVWDPTGIIQNTHLPRDPSNDTHPREFNVAKKYIEENPDKVVVTTYPINDDRDVFLKTGKEWVLFFNTVRNFTPTTVMQIGYKKHVFVLKKAKINKNDEVVFYISTKEILVNNNNNNSEQMKKLKKIPLGKHKNVRFDIDSLYGNSIEGNVCNGNDESGGPPGTNTCYCPAGSYITTMAKDYIGLCMSDCDGGYSNYGGICYENCDSGYYTDGITCSEECTGDTWSFGCDCWEHAGYWPHWSIIAYTKREYPRGGAYIPSSFIWGNSDGYFCNSDGYRWDIKTGNNGAPAYGDVGICGSFEATTCWNAGNNSNQCCAPAGDSSCCPPGSSC